MTFVDPLDDEVERWKRGEAPPPFGVMEFQVIGSPASIQSAKPIRDSYIADLRKIFENNKYILSGELLLEVRWLLPAKSRFETDAKADIDNCIKPIIDAFTGPTGLFIDDCQLKGLYIYWNHIVGGDERLDFKFEFTPGDFHEKDGLAFVRFAKGLCAPVNLNWPRQTRQFWAELLKAGELTKKKFEELGTDYLALAGLLGSSRPYHVTRVQGFKLLSLDEFAGDLTEDDSSPL